MRFPRLQFHLSTAIILMFVAGGLLWANMRPFDSYIVANMLPVKPAELTLAYGFPFCYGRDWVGWVKDDGSHIWDWRYGNLVLDILVALAILLATAILCEWLTRRRANPKSKI
ncbi:MAG: hypothetical protein NTW87_04305 [Planctomycetota bacterium]|nr:hypothetical protein [Planctomycetota bacterium]